MGGGDLNSKKSWHPNTLKNQELVWKAEQKAAQEKKMIAELQRERAQERDRAELNEMARRSKAAASSSDDRLSWMYDKPDKTVPQEDYLLGKAVDSNFDRSEKAEQDAIPAVSRRVVGSSMLDPGLGDSQVDLVRKMREDPLLLIKERERAARAALLQNPLQRKKLTELLRKEQKQSEERKIKKKDKDLDGQLAAKLSALSGGKGINLAALLESGNSSSSESSESEKAKKKKKKKEKKKKSKKSKKNKTNSNSIASGDSDDQLTYQKGDKRKSIVHASDDNEETYCRKGDHRLKHRSSRDRSPAADQRYWHKSARDERETRVQMDHSRKREGQALKRGRRSPKRSRSPSPRYTYASKRDKNTLKRGKSPRRGGESPKRQKTSPSRSRINDSVKQSSGISEAEKAARLAEMARAGEAHERERGQRVAQQRVAGAREEARRGAAGAEARALPTSLEARIHSNRHNIQRSERHMNEHFARR